MIAGPVGAEGFSLLREGFVLQRRDQGWWWQEEMCLSVPPRLLHALTTQATGWPVACAWPVTAAEGGAVTVALSVPHRV